MDGPWAARCTGLLSQRPGYGAGPPRRAAPRGRQTVPRLPRGVPLCSWLGAVQAEGQERRARSGGPGERRVAAAGEAGFASRDKYLQARPCTPLGRLGALNIDYSNGKFSSRALFGLSHVKAGMGGAPVGESALGFSPRPVLLPRRGPSLRLVYCPPAVGLKRCEAELSPCPRQRTGVAVGWAPACVSGSLPPLPG